MGLRVVADRTGHRIESDSGDVEVVNAFLEHLSIRNFSPATRRAYAFDLLNFLRFLAERALRLKDLIAADVFDYLDWQRQPASTAKSAVVVKLSSRAGVTPATMNRRIAARFVRVRRRRRGVRSPRTRRRYHPLQPNSAKRQSKA